MSAPRELEWKQFCRERYTQDWMNSLKIQRSKGTPLWVLRAGKAYGSH
jgi:hypothetical protein